MKKTYLAGGIVLGALLTAALVIRIFFPGLPDYLIVKQKYENIDRTITQFQATYVPDTFQKVKTNGIQFSLPKEYQATASGQGYSNGSGQTVLLVSKVDAAAISEYLPNEPWDGFLYTEADYRHYFQTVGAPYPGSSTLSMKIFWYLRGTLNAETCLHLRGQDLKVFREFAVLKEDGWNNESTWELPLAGCTAYVTQGVGTGEIGGGLSNGLWSVTVYPDGGSEHISMMMGMQDANTAKQIISSISYTG